MSSLLEEAFVEANTLKEAAKQQAQAELAEKYAKELDQKINKLLEQQGVSAIFEQEEDEDPLAGDDLGMADDLGLEDDLDAEGGEEDVEDTMDDQIPYSYSDDERMCPCEDEDEEVEIDLDQLIAMADDEDETHEEVADEIAGGEEDMELGGEEEGEEELKLEEDLLANLFEQDYLQALAEELSAGESKPRESLRVSRTAETNGEKNDMSLDDATAAHEKGSLDVFLDSLAKADEDEEETEKSPARPDHSHKLQKELEESKKIARAHESKIKSLQESNKKLKKFNDAFSEKLQEASDALVALSLENDKLRYQNSVLESTSLNERQKTKLVEAISRAKSEQEAKSIYALKENFTASASPNRSSENPLESILNKRPAPAMNLRRREPLLNESNNQDRELERQRQVWKKLAGIDN